MATSLCMSRIIHLTRTERERIRRQPSHIVGVIGPSARSLKQFVSLLATKSQACVDGHARPRRFLAVDCRYLPRSSLGIRCTKNRTALPSRPSGRRATIFDPNHSGTLPTFFGTDSALSGLPADLLEDAGLSRGSSYRVCTKRFEVQSRSPYHSGSSVHLGS